jgi:hypothetical protein
VWFSGEQELERRSHLMGGAWEQASCREGQNEGTDFRGI